MHGGLTEHLGRPCPASPELVAGRGDTRAAMLAGSSGPFATAHLGRSAGDGPRWA